MLSVESCGEDARVHACVRIPVYACIACARSRCSPSLPGSSAQFCRLQQNEVSSPAAGPPPAPPSPSIPSPRPALEGTDDIY